MCGTECFAFCFLGLDVTEQALPREEYNQLTVINSSEKLWIT